MGSTARAWFQSRWMLLLLGACVALALTLASPWARADTQPSTAVVPPRLLPHDDVAYPRGAEGDATVSIVVTVNADGSVRSARVAEGREPFAQAAADAVAFWHFDPATRG